MTAVTTAFRVGKPVGPDDIVDREEFLDQLVQRLRDGNSVVLAAPRRTGKTSLALEALRLLREEHVCCTASVDLTGTPSVRELAERLTVSCLENLSRSARSAARTWRGLGELARMPEVRARLHELELSVALRKPDDRSESLLLDEALDMPQRIATRLNAPCVVLLDEFQEAVGIGGRALLARMRAAFQLQENTSFLFLGSQAGLMTQLFGQRTQPFFRFGTLLDLPPIPDGAWRAYIRRKMGAAGVRVGDDALDAVLARTGGHPYDTMKVAYELYLMTRAGGSADVRYAAAACEEAQAQLATVFDAEIGALPSLPRVVLGRVAKGDPLFRDQRSQASVRNALTLLVRTGVLRRLGRGRYDFAEPMLARHLRGPT